MSTTATVKFINGIPMTVPNKITKPDNNYHISYNNFSISDYGSDTTGLYIKKTGQFLILNGKHVDAYNKCQSLKECIDYFYKNIEFANHMSEHGKIFKYTAEKGEYVKGGF